MKRLTALAFAITLLAFGPGCGNDIGTVGQKISCYDTAAGVMCTEGDPASVDLDGDGVEDTLLCEDFEGADQDGDGIDDDEDTDDDDDGIADEDDDDSDDDGIDDDEDTDDDNDGIADEDDCDELDIDEETDGTDD